MPASWYTGVNRKSQLPPTTEAVRVEMKIQDNILILVPGIPSIK